MMQGLLPEINDYLLDCLFFFFLFFRHHQRYHYRKDKHAPYNRQRQR